MPTLDWGDFGDLVVGITTVFVAKRDSAYP
jgi:hypothetical protein